MPVYSYACPTCGATSDAYRKVDDRHDCPRCLTPACYNGRMQLRIMPTFVRPDIEPYESPIDGRVINSRVQRAEDLKRNGCRPYEGREQEQKEVDRQRAYAEAKRNEQLEASAHNAFNNMPRAAQRAIEGQ